MGLIQTINVEAKSRLKGIKGVADASTAVNRWVVTGSMRSQFVNSLPEISDMKTMILTIKSLTNIGIKKTTKTSKI